MRNIQIYALQFTILAYATYSQDVPTAAWGIAMNTILGTFHELS
jgi:hypothetical protein